MIKLFSFLVFLFSIISSAFASCPNIMPSISIEYRPKSPTVNYVESSQLSKSIGTFASQDTLGTFSADQSVQLDSKMSFSGNLLDVCGKVTNVNLIFSMNSKILIAKEAATVPCVNNRVLAHENRHFELTSQAMENAKAYARDLFTKIASKEYTGPSEISVSNQVKQDQTVALEKLNDYISRLSTQLNAPLDTSENYNQEAKICSSFDEDLVHSKIRRIN